MGKLENSGRWACGRVHSKKGIQGKGSLWMRFRVVAENKVCVGLGVQGEGAKKKWGLQGKWTQVGKRAWNKGGVEGTGVSVGSSELKDPGKKGLRLAT